MSKTILCVLLLLAAGCGRAAPTRGRTVHPLTPAQQERVKAVFAVLGDAADDSADSWCKGIATDAHPETTIQILEAMVTIFNNFKQQRYVTPLDIADVRSIMWGLGDRDQQSPGWRTVLRHGLSSNEAEQIWGEYTNAAHKIIANAVLETLGGAQPTPLPLR
jgi:hypothetical protein